MGSTVGGGGGGQQYEATKKLVAENNPGKMLMTGFGVEGKNLAGQLSEQLAAKKNARANSRMLLADAKVNQQENLSASSTLG
jgi:hypothetical protein